MRLPESIGVVLLAAGASRRLGRPKQLLDFNGRPLLQHAIDVVNSLEVNKRLLILGSNAKQIQQAIDPGFMEIIRNDQWEEGMASSIRLGLSVLLERNQNTQHALFLLSDQPYLSTEVLQQLVAGQARDKRSITACRYQDELGVPMILSHHFFNELQQLQGDHGAKKLVMQHQGVVHQVPFEKGAIDIDTDEDYRMLMGGNSQGFYNEPK